MFIEEEFRTGIKDIEKDGLISNKAILEILENVACYHSDIVGYGPLDIKKTNTTWILLEWKIQVLKRPIYGEKLKTRTWARTFTKAFTYRDFEIYDSKGNKCVIGTSKWVLVDGITKKITRITSKFEDYYKPEMKHVFENEEVEKIILPDDFIEQKEYKVRRRDIDINKHVHNIYYLDIADEALPQNVYEKRPYDNLRITYKTGIKLGDTVICKYGEKENKQIVKIENETGKTNAIIALW